MTVRHHNSFDLLRIAFALFVIITHAYPLTGMPELDWLKQITWGQISFSNLAVSGFFIISGFLVTKSLYRSGNVFTFYIKRIARIYPGLFTVLLITVLLACIPYTGTLSQYVHNHSPRSYVISNLMLSLQPGIDGVFEQLPYAKVINGSIWTIAYEACFYLILPVLLLLPQKVWKYVTGAVLIFCYFTFLYCVFNRPLVLQKMVYSLQLYFVLNYGAYFAAGATLAVLPVFTHLTKPVLLIFIVFMVVSLGFKFYPFIQYVVYPVVVLGIGGLEPPQWVQRVLKKTGDISYGIYLYAFPVQQTLMFYFGLTYLPLMFWTAVVALPLGYCSWHLVEKRAMHALNRYLKPTPQVARGI